MNISGNKKDEYLARLAEVIRTDATNIDHVYFLATHTPFKKLTHVTSGIKETGKTVMDEEKFFRKHVLECRSDHQFIIVQGDNGTGKSHFIRWVKERYEKVVSSSEEAVLFISRSQSTLRGALEQIINSGIFQESDAVTQLKKLILANEHLSENDLKQNIIHQFAIAVQNNEGKSLLSSKIEKNLYAFLVEPSIQEFMFRPFGPIDRIKLRLAAENSNQRLDDISPRFETEDFVITVDLLTTFKQSDASRRAIRLAESLFADDNAPQLRSDLANYLNQFLETVVQRCANLRGSDLKEVFQHLRKELKASGKDLTLFIEDITSFTGIDRALVEVLVTEHKGTDYNEEYCRLLSFVGITNEYYNTSIPDNLKERVTGRVLIDRASLFDGTQISEMAARYLNAIYIDRKELVEWIKNGAEEASFPIASIFKEHEWATFKLKGNRSLTLFPFNVISLGRFYESLDKKTPRRFLKHILTHLLQLQFSSEEFPPKITDLSNEFDNLPNFKDSFSNRTIEIKAPNHIERLTSFLRVWGDGTVNTTEMSTQLFVGGLPEVAFTAFGLPFIAEKDRVVEKFDRKPPFESIGTKTIPIPDPVEIPAKLSPGQIAFKKVEMELDRWLNSNGKITSYTNFRDDIYDAFIDFIDWEAEGLSSPLVKNFFISRKIHIEGQSVTISGSDILTIEKSSGTYYALLAFAAWRHRGNKSWSFDKSVDYLPSLYNWLETQKSKVIAIVRYPKDTTSPDEWKFSKWTLLTNYYLAVLSGTINRSDSSLKVYQALFQPPNITLDQNRSTNWMAMKKRLGQSKVGSEISMNYSMLKGMYNRVQGTITDKTDVHFLDAAAILKDISELKKSNWDIEIMVPDKSSYKETIRYASLQVLEVLKQVVPPAINGETALIEDRVGKIMSYIGSEEDSIHLFTETQELLNYFRSVNEGFNTEHFIGLQNRQLNQQNLMFYLNILKQIRTLMDNELLLGLINCPIDRITEYINLFEKTEYLVQGKYARFDGQYRNFEQKLKDSKTEDIIDNTRQKIETLRSDIKGIHQEVSDVTR